MSTIGNFINPYLFHTGTWIYSQLTQLQNHRTIVFTHITENLDKFPHPNIVSVADLNVLQRAFHQCVSQVTWRHFYWFYQEAVRRQNVDIFHAHFGSEAVFAKPVLDSFPGIPLVVSFYGLDVSKLPKQKYWRQAYAVMFRRAKLVLAEGNFMKQALENLGCPPEKVLVQHLGIDLQKYPFCPRASTMPGQLIRILHCASLREKKGHEFALRAFAKVKQQFPNIEFTIIGDGPLLGKLKILTEHLGVADSVKFLGVKSHDDAIKEFLRAQILLYPSVTAVDGDTEGGAPVTIIEALATGMPVVSSFHADIPEVIKDGVTGLLAPERDVEQLAQHLRFLLSNPLCWTSMGDAARAHVEKSYNLRLQLERLGEIYSILDRHGQSLH